MGDMNWEPRRERERESARESVNDYLPLARATRVTHQAPPSCNTSKLADDPTTFPIWQVLYVGDETFDVRFGVRLFAQPPVDFLDHPSHNLLDLFVCEDELLALFTDLERKVTKNKTKDKY